MRDFRDAKAMAQSIRAALAAKGQKITVGESLELTAKALGAGDWNKLSATIKAAEAESNKAAPEAPPAEPVGGAYALAAEPRRQRFSPNLADTLHRAVHDAVERKCQHTTLEHLLLALTDDPDAMAVMAACLFDRDGLRRDLIAFVDNEATKAAEDDADPVPTDAFHGAVRRAVIHVQSSGRDAVTGANVLVAIFSERESRACHMLKDRGLTRFDAVNFIAHGVRKGDAAA
ncbi:MAG TPA: glyoxalase superfamily protein [Caulobacteraceae bacterium]|jgi:hypothetical protein